MSKCRRQHVVAWVARRVGKLGRFSGGRRTRATGFGQAWKTFRFRKITLYGDAANATDERTHHDNVISYARTASECARFSSDREIRAKNTAAAGAPQQVGMYARRHNGTNSAVSGSPRIPKYARPTMACVRVLRFSLYSFFLPSAAARPFRRAIITTRGTYFICSFLFLTSRPAPRDDRRR